MVSREFWGDRPVLVTGHTGFKGGWLTLWLRELGAEVTGYALAPDPMPSLFLAAGVEGACRHVVADVRDLARLRAVVREARPDVVFHLAAQPLVRLSYEQPVLTYETNVMGTVNLLEAVRACPSAPCTRAAIRAARRMTCSLPGAPERATTMRSAVSHGTAMPRSLR